VEDVGVDCSLRGKNGNANTRNGFVVLDAVLLTIVFFIGLSTCWWYNSLNWGAIKEIQG